MWNPTILHDENQKENKIQHFSLHVIFNVACICENVWVSVTVCVRACVCVCVCVCVAYKSIIHFYLWKMYVLETGFLTQCNLEQ